MLPYIGFLLILLGNLSALLPLFAPDMPDRPDVPLTLAGLLTLMHT